AVDIDFVSGQLGGEDLREEDEARLRYRVGAEAGQALAAGDGADIDEAAALARTDGGAADGLRDQERAAQVYVEHAPPLALFEVKQRHAVAPAAGSCVVHEDVDASEFAPRFVCEPIALIRLRDVDDERESPAADGLDFVRNRVYVAPAHLTLVRREGLRRASRACDDDVRALPGKRQGDVAADAAIASGARDDGNLAGQRLQALVLWHGPRRIRMGAITSPPQRR